jgi:hypothetical protein
MHLAMLQEDSTATKGPPTTKYIPQTHLPPQMLAQGVTDEHAEQRRHGGISNSFPNRAIGSWKNKGGVPASMSNSRCQVVGPRIVKPESITADEERAQTNKNKETVP